MVKGKSDKQKKQEAAQRPAGSKAAKGTTTTGSKDLKVTTQPSLRSQALGEALLKTRVGALRKARKDSAAIQNSVMNVAKESAAKSKSKASGKIGNEERREASATKGQKEKGCKETRDKSGKDARKEAGGRKGEKEQDFKETKNGKATGKTAKGETEKEQTKEAKPAKKKIEQGKTAGNGEVKEVERIPRKKTRCP